MKKYSLLLLLIFVLQSAGACGFITGDTESKAHCSKDACNESGAFHLVNNTKLDVDDLVWWTCKYLELHNITICIAPQSQYFKESGFVIKQGDLYFIYLKEDNPHTNLILVHELIHVKQYETGELAILNKSFVSYKGVKINLKIIDYERRSYEIDAHASDSKILQEYYRERKALRLHEAL